jgi:hypothetical protein
MQSGPGDKSIEELEQDISAGLPTSLIGRFVDATEVADAEHAAAITGATLRVDGGIVRFVA